MSYRERHADLHQEEDVVPPWKILLALLVTLLIGAVFVLAALSMTASANAALRPSGFFAERYLGPRRPVGRVRQDLFDEPAAGVTVTERKREELGSYGWVDRDRGVVRIPIDRAMDLVVEGRRP